MTPKPPIQGLGVIRVSGQPPEVYLGWDSKKKEPILKSLEPAPSAPTAKIAQ